MVSILMLAYNHEKYVSRALDSILSQKTDFNYRIVIGEDCSQDATLEIIDKFRLNYPEKIKLVTSDKNVGMVNNFNRTLSACDGRYICFCEADDFWHSPDKLQKQIEYMENNPQCGLVHSDLDWLYVNDGNLIKKFHKSRLADIPTGNIYESLLCQNFIYTPTVCARTHLVKSCFDYNYILRKKFKMIDYPLWIEISRKADIGFIDESLATYRILSCSASHPKLFFDKIRFAHSSYSMIFNTIIKYGCKPKTLLKIVLNYLMTITYLCAMEFL